MSRRENYHIVPNGGQWAVQREGASRATSLHPTQAAAITAGREHAINRSSELVIHRPNGQIRDSDSYGNDPTRSKDTKH